MNNSKTAAHEKATHRVRHPRHVGRDGLVRPSAADETAGYFIFQRIDINKISNSEDYVAHISCSEKIPGWLFATTKYFLTFTVSETNLIFFRHLIFVTEKPSVPDVFGVEWYFLYKAMKGPPLVKFDPDQIEVFLKVS